MLSFLYDLRPEQFELFAEALRRLVEEMGGRKRVLVLIPDPRDIR